MKRIITMLALVASFQSFAANVYIRDGGSGDGSSWSSALDDLPTSFTRGNTYYVADGAYGGHDFTTAASGTTVITIKKATASDHGTETGWSSTYGDGVATFSAQLAFTTAYWVFNGATGGGPSAWDTGFGFEITETGVATAAMYVTGNNVTASHFKITGCDCGNSDGGSTGNDGIWINSQGCTFSYAWINNVGRCPVLSRGGGNNIFEYLLIGHYYADDDPHGESWVVDQTSGSTTIRWSLIEHIHSTGGIMFDNNNNHAHLLHIYGNVFYKPSSHDWVGNNGVIGGWTGGNGEDCYGMRIYNNTFISMNVPAFTSFIDRSGDNNARNNLFYNCDSPSFNDIQTHDYNHFINSGGAHSEANGTSAASGDPFTAFASRDFSLTANTTAGVALSSPYDVDMFGNTRSSWTRGAIEFTSGVTNPPVITSSLSATGTNGQAVSYSITTSNTATSWTASPLPAGLTISGSTISGTPTVTGSTSTTITATNSAGGDSETLTWTIYDAPAPSPVFSIAPSSLSFGYVATNTAKDLTFVVSNSGPSGTVLTGSTSAATSPWTIVGDGSYTVSNTQTKTITVRYTPTAAGVASGFVSFNNGTSNAVSGSAYPISSTTNWPLVRSLIISPMATNSANYISSPTDSSSSVAASRAVFGWYAPSDGTIKLWATSIATNGVADSYYIGVNKTPSVSDIWDMLPWTTNWAVSYVHLRGNGTFDAPQYYTNAFNVTNGLNYIVLSAREADARVRDMNIVFTSGDAPPSIAITTPTSFISTNASVIAFTGTASDAVGLSSVSVTNITTGTGSTVTGTTSWSASVTVTAGANSIVATARDSSAQTTSVTNTVVYDNVAPTLSITSPTNGVTLTQPSVTLSNVVSDASGVSSVNSTNVTTGAKIDLSASYKGVAVLQVGANVIRTIAQDVVGNRTTNSVTVTYSLAIPGTTNRVFILRVGL